jgi:hypothetical protein
MPRSFRPHRIYLFELRNGRRKLAYGQSPEDALEVLRMRLGEAEMAEILVDRWERISQRRLREVVHLLG